MLSELKKSVNYIIYERTTSPFWGSFIFSWVICNWKIVMTIFVVNEDKLPVNKIDYISQNLINWKPVALYPFISTTILITIFPILSNGAYWLTIIYSKWRLDKKNTVEEKQLLTIEQSIAIRISSRQLEENYSRLVSDKETEITALKLEIKEMRSKFTEAQSATENIPIDKPKTELDEWQEEYEQFKVSSKFNDFERLLIDLNSNLATNSYNTQMTSIIYFQSLGLIEPKNAGQQLTQKGKYFSKLFNRKYETPSE
ncbi:hypothetical protein ABIC45_004058 [Mucilaginibacter rubeus]|uniref:hypothetical protein n=1 Tax=Mucilaginibacter rubeus TaxID=2027860 RepID=UPI003396EBEF